jgi:hypothetical protein
MAALVIQIKKKADGSAALKCRRADGSDTWQRQDGPQGRFFPLHDLTHYAVETVLGHARGFYGLVAAGWDLADFGSPSRRGQLPSEALAAERIVGFLDLERAGGKEWVAADFNATAPPGCVLTDDDLRRVRDRRRELFGAWNTLPVGETLELEFPAPRAS